MADNAKVEWREHKIQCLAHVRLVSPLAQLRMPWYLVHWKHFLSRAGTLRLQHTKRETI
eukprot:SAG31_NODE_19289_length_607_cov_0.812992_1_plen_58_part_01